MRLPADAVLIVIDMQEAIDDPRFGARNNLDAEANIAGQKLNGDKARAPNAPAPKAMALRRHPQAKITLSANDLKKPTCRKELRSTSVNGLNSPTGSIRARHNRRNNRLLEWIEARFHQTYSWSPLAIRRFAAPRAAPPALA